MACSWTQRRYRLSRNDSDCYKGLCNWTHACWLRVQLAAWLFFPYYWSAIPFRLLTKLLPWSLTWLVMTRPRDQCGRGSDCSPTWSCSSASLPWLEGYHLMSQAPVESLDHLYLYQWEHEPYHPNKVPFLILNLLVHAVTLVFTQCWLKKMRKMAYNQ